MGPVHLSPGVAHASGDHESTVRKRGTSTSHVPIRSPTPCVIAMAAQSSAGIPGPVIDKHELGHDLGCRLSLPGKRNALPGP
jgi:hypothetical protein